MTLTPYNHTMTALTVWREARGENGTAKLGVAFVIRNRTEDLANRWPKAPADVALEHHVVISNGTRKTVYQFSSFSPGDPNAVQFPPSASDPIWGACCTAVDLSQSSTTADPTLGANCYHSHQVQAEFPSWADPNKLTAQIGAFRFYKL